MDWSDEPWVKLYTRDTATLMAVRWQGRLVLWELMRKVDRAGVLDVEADSDEERDALVAELLRLPHEVCAEGIARLIRYGVVVAQPGHLVLANFIEAQEAASSDKQRQRERRARRKDRARAAKEGLIPAEPGESVTKRDESVTRGHALELPLIDPEQTEAAGVREGGTGQPSDADGPPQAPLGSLHDVTIRDNPSRNTTEPSRGVTNRIEENRIEETSPDTHVHSGRAALKRAADIAQKLKGISPQAFEDVYALYPVKKGKARGLKKAREKIKTPEEFRTFEQAVQAMHEAWKEVSPRERRFCPHFSTFVNQERWRDEELPLPGPDRRRETSTGNGRYRGYADAPTDRSIYESDQDIGIE